MPCGRSRSPRPPASRYPRNPSETSAAHPAAAVSASSRSSSIRRSTANSGASPSNWTCRSRPLPWRPLAISSKNTAGRGSLEDRPTGCPILWRKPYAPARIAFMHACIHLAYPDPEGRQHSCGDEVVKHWTDDVRDLRNQALRQSKLEHHRGTHGTDTPPVRKTDHLINNTATQQRARQSQSLSQNACSGCYLTWAVTFAFHKFYWSAGSQPQAALSDRGLRPSSLQAPGRRGPNPRNRDRGSPPVRLPTPRPSALRRNLRPGQYRLAPRLCPSRPQSC